MSDVRYGDPNNPDDVEVLFGKPVDIVGRGKVWVIDRKYSDPPMVGSPVFVFDIDAPAEGYDDESSCFGEVVGIEQMTALTWPTKPVGSFGVLVKAYDCD